MFDRSFDDPQEFVVDTADLDNVPLANIFKTVENIVDTREDASVSFERDAHQTAKKDNSSNKEPAPAEKSEPTVVYTQQELDAAVAEALENGKKEGYGLGKKDGYDIGFKDGNDKGCAETRAAVTIEYDEKNETKQAAAAADIAKAVTDIAQKYAVEQDAVFHAAVDIAAAVCRKAVPAFCSRHGTEEIVSFLQDAFRFLKDEPKVTLHLHSNMTKGLKTRLERIVAKESFGGKIAVVCDDSLQAGDCLIEWKNGGIERKIQDVLNKTDALLKSYSESTPKDSDMPKQGE